MKLKSTITMMLALVIAGISTGCAPHMPPPITKGVVVDKNHNPESDYTTLECGAFGENGLCSMWYTAYHHDDESWDITIEATPEGEQEARQSSYSLSEGDWERVTLGETWEAPPQEKR